MSSSAAGKPSSRSTKKSKEISSVFGLKAAIIIVGFILLVAVLSLLYLSSWTVVAKHRYALLTSAFIYPTSTYILLLCSLCASISIIALFFMAWVEHRRGLNITLIILILTFFLEITAGLLAFGYTMSLNERLSRNLLETIKERYAFDKKTTETFDQLQRRFHCCGSVSFKDWELNPNFNSSMAFAVPDSCCRSYEIGCARKPYGKHPSNIFYEGCSSALYRFYHSHLITLGCLSVGVASLQMFIIVLLLYLIKRLRKLFALNHQIEAPPKPRRLSNEITYYPIQSSPSRK